MKRLIAAGLASGVLLLAGGCGNSGYGTVTGQPDLTSFNGNPGPATPSCTNPARSANTALYCPAAGILPYPFDVYFAGSTDGTLKPLKEWPEALRRACSGFDAAAGKAHFWSKNDAADKLLKHLGGYAPERHEVSLATLADDVKTAQARLAARSK